MKIISYNVNGIRAALKKGFLDWLQAANPDVICIQETKAHKEQIDVSEIENTGYPYHYWFSAQKKGYSSVAIFCKEKPNHIEYGTGIEIMDIKYSPELFRVTGVDDTIRFIDHSDNYDIVVIPAGRQHNGEEFVKFYHTIFQDYHWGSPNGEYKLVDEIQLFDMLNTNYNQSK